MSSHELAAESSRWLDSCHAWRQTVLIHCNQPRARCSRRPQRSRHGRGSQPKHMHASCGGSRKALPEAITTKVATPAWRSALSSGAPTPERHTHRDRLPKAIYISVYCSASDGDSLPGRLLCCSAGSCDQTKQQSNHTRRHTTTRAF